MVYQSSVQFSSVQDGVYALGKAHICVPPRLSRVSSLLPFKQFQSVGLTDDGPFSSSQAERSLSAQFLFLRISPPGDRWCVMSAGSVSSSSTLQITRRKPPVMVGLPASLIIMNRLLLNYHKLFLSQCNAREIRAAFTGESEQP